MIPRLEREIKTLESQIEFSQKKLSELKQKLANTMTRQDFVRKYNTDPEAVIDKYTRFLCEADEDDKYIRLVGAGHYGYRFKIDFKIDDRQMMLRLDEMKGMGISSDHIDECRPTQMVLDAFHFIDGRCEIYDFCRITYQLVAN